MKSIHAIDLPRKAAEENCCISRLWLGHEPGQCLVFSHIHLIPCPPGPIKGFCETAFVCFCYLVLATCIKARRSKCMHNTNSIHKNISSTTRWDRRITALVSDLAVKEILRPTNGKSLRNPLLQARHAHKLRERNVCNARPWSLVSGSGSCRG